ncbi:hypothetical protein VCSRO208_3504 [Vibrio cholerae]|nr:hypothetical protein [Vibrio cholerae]EGR4325501.1 hypothetical protein [Vibrio cholerae]EKF9132586.1 hypothetical protein [Vibrio cholerae]EKF9430383.1 hypothetical protein [Vibrio cholerae]EKO5183645.1 hypothetical protein [Vibrio cholerae]
MYKFTALLNFGNHSAYLSGNNNCLGTLSLSEMCNIAVDISDLPESSGYRKWASKLNSIADFEFCVFYSETEAEAMNRAEKYAVQMGCIYISKGRVTVAADRA